VKSDIANLDSADEGSALGEKEGSGLMGDDEVDASAIRGILVDTYGLSLHDQYDLYSGGCGLQLCCSRLLARDRRNTGPDRRAGGIWHCPGRRVYRAARSCVRRQGRMTAVCLSNQPEVHSGRVSEQH
jgi:hypothetical protein